MKMSAKVLAWLACAAVCALHAAVVEASQIALTKHNLTATGTGSVHTTESVGLCVFCHTPHNANPTQGLWNRDLSAATYTLYSSTTLQSQLNQPTGSSRLCLSCHDGTIALDNMRVLPKSGPLLLGALTGKSVVGTDLSGHHPISFTYDTALALKRAELVDPHALPGSVRLDDQQQLQCTSCHDPHEDKYAKFLRTDTRGGALCTACHSLSKWNTSAHATSTATWNGSGTSPWPSGAYATVADNACLNCHRPHAAAHPERLLASFVESENCTVCHNGSVSPKNISAEFLKPSRHPIEDSNWVHDANESPLTMTRHVTCSDCHNAHVANATSASPPLSQGALRGVKSVTQAGSLIADPAYEYEVCNKCHGLKEPTTLGIQRQSLSRNIRLKIDPSNMSYHPIAATGTNTSIQGLQQPFTASSMMSCITCHNSDSWTATGLSPKGPHGSLFEPILAAQYITSDPSVEFYPSYALCYQCHNQTFLITDQARTFPHQRHVVNDQASCASCHDAHGSRQNAHLIDFMLRDRNGTPVVSPSPSTGQLSYVSLGNGHGQCTLACHGYDHKPSVY